MSINLFRANGSRGGVYRARWRDSRGRVQNFSTNNSNKDEARKIAEEERRRREAVQQQQQQPQGSPQTPAVNPSAPLLSGEHTNGHNGHTNGHRKPIGEAMLRALGQAAPAAGSPPTTLVPEVVGTKKAEDQAEREARTRRLYEVAGKALTYLTEGGLKRAVRFAGREPEDMDDDEQALIREGYTDLCQEWFGKTELGPWGKVAVGSLVAGVGMWAGGKPIPKPAPPALPMNPRGDVEDGGKGA